MSTAADKRAAADAASVRKYLAKLPAKVRSRMATIRRLARSIAPRAIDRFGYGIPGLRVEGRLLIWYAAWKAHIGVYPLDKATEKLAVRAGYGISTRGTLRLPHDRPIPAGLIKSLVRKRLRRESELR